MRSGISAADWAIQVAGRVYLDESYAGVLLVRRAQAAIVGTAMFLLRSKVEGWSARLVVSFEASIQSLVAKQQRL